MGFFQNINNDAIYDALYDKIKQDIINNQSAFYDDIPPVNWHVWIPGFYKTTTNLYKFISREIAPRITENHNLFFIDFSFAEKSTWGCDKPHTIKQIKTVTENLKKYDVDFINHILTSCPEINNNERIIRYFHK